MKLKINKDIFNYNPPTLPLFRVGDIIETDDHSHYSGDGFKRMLCVVMLGDTTWNGGAPIHSYKVLTLDDECMPNGTQAWINQTNSILIDESGYGFKLILYYNDIKLREKVGGDVIDGFEKRHPHQPINNGIDPLYELNKICDKQLLDNFNTNILKNIEDLKIRQEVIDWLKYTTDKHGILFDEAKVADRIHSMTMEEVLRLKHINDIAKSIEGLSNMIKKFGK